MLQMCFRTYQSMYNMKTKVFVNIFNLVLLQETTQHDLAGYVKGKGNIKLALIRNAGHSAPMDQPQWTLRLIESFVNENRP